MVGLTLRYTLLTTTGSFALLAAVLLPVAMLAVVGRADKRAIYGIGFGFFVFGEVPLYTTYLGALLIVAGAVAVSRR